MRAFLGRFLFKFGFIVMPGDQADWCMLLIDVCAGTLRERGYRVNVVIDPPIEVSPVGERLAEVRGEK